MSWKLENNTKRIYNVFKRSKCQIYSKDIEALKEVLNYVNEGNKVLVNDNLLFSKLLSIHLRQNLNYYGSIGGAIAATKELLKETLNNNLEMLRIDLNSVDLQNYFKSIGIVDEFTTEQRLNNNYLLSENQKEIVDKCKKNWTIEKVEKSLINSVNDFLKDVDNYK
jgi:hypothetical protein